MFESMPQQNNDQATFVGTKRLEDEQGFDIERADTLWAEIERTSPLGVAELELIEQTLADDSGEMHIYCLDAIREMTPALFNSAIHKRDVFAAFMQAERAFEYNLADHQTMKTRLIDLIDELLAGSIDVVVAEERTKLEKLRQRVIEESFSGVSSKTELSSEAPVGRLNETDRQVLKKALEDAQREIIPASFERALLNNELILVEECLSSARRYDLPEYAEMRQRTLAYIEKELEKDDAQIHHDYQARLENLKSRILDLTESA